jgi:hypothetical protein
MSDRSIVVHAYGRDTVSVVQVAGVQDTVTGSSDCMYFSVHGSIHAHGAGDEGDAYSLGDWS